VRDLVGRTAFVTGGASGIGFALGRAFAQAGMKVMLADIEADAMTKAIDALREFHPHVHGVTCDVTDPASVERAAEAAYQAFGRVHVVCNNAGVGGGSGIDDISLDAWRWVLDVNLMGVLHGIRTFLPHMRAHGEGGHFVNTASMAGMVSGLGFSPYATSKFAVVGMSEGLAAQLQPLGIGVTVLCPGFVRTRIAESGRNRPERYGTVQAPHPASWAGALAAEIRRRVESGLDPAEVAARVLMAVRDNQPYVFTDPEMREDAEQRFTAILAAMAADPMPRYDRDYLLDPARRNQLIELWEVEKFGRDSFGDPNAVSLYGRTPAQWHGHGVRILARTALEAVRDPLGERIGAEIAGVAATRRSAPPCA
jgi:NAD(P)-dependent dehydrogenase (short-subunit alcohol dehydrogenase family)